MTQIKKSSMPSKNHPDHHVLVNSQYLQPVASDDVYSELLMTAGDECHAPLGLHVSCVLALVRAYHYHTIVI